MKFMKFDVEESIDELLLIASICIGGSFWYGVGYGIYRLLLLIGFEPSDAGADAIGIIFVAIFIVQWIIFMSPKSKMVHEGGGVWMVKDEEKK